MRPCPICPNAPNCTVRNSIDFRNNMRIARVLADISNILLCKFCSRIKCARTVAGSVPFFITAIIQVVFLRSKEKVIRVYAGWRIAFMENLHSLLYWLLCMLLINQSVKPYQFSMQLNLRIWKTGLARANMTTVFIHGICDLFSESVSNFILCRLINRMPISCRHFCIPLRNPASAGVCKNTTLFNWLPRPDMFSNVSLQTL